MLSLDHKSNFTKNVSHEKDLFPALYYLYYCDCYNGL